LAKRNQFDNSAIRLSLAKQIQFDISVIGFGDSVWQFTLAIQIGNSFWFGNSVWEFSLSFGILVQPLGLTIQLGNFGSAIYFGDSVRQFHLAFQFDNSLW
jgi:hypothetical protein